MRRFVFIGFIFLFQLLSFSQNDVYENDSLLLLLKKSQNIEKVKILLELSDLNIYDKTGLAYATDAFELAKKLKDNVYQAEALNAIGKYHIIHYDEAKSLEYFFHSLSLLEANKNQPNIGKTLRNIGQAYYYLDSVEQASLYTNKALTHARKTKDRRLEADALVDLGTLESLKGNIDSALIYLHQALDIRIEEEAMLDVAHSYNRLGRLYEDLDESGKAIENFQKEIEIRKLEGDLIGLFSASYNLGRIHAQLGNYQLAIEQFQNSLTIAEKINNQ